MSHDLYSNISSEQILSQLKLHFSGQSVLDEALLKTYLNILMNRGVITDNTISNLQKLIMQEEIVIPKVKQTNQTVTEERMATFKEYNTLKKEVSSAGMSIIYACVWAFVAIISSFIGAGIAMSGELSPKEIPEILTTTSVISAIAGLGFFITLYSAGVKFRDTVPQK